jgi:hypothetical protein
MMQAEPKIDKQQLIVDNETRAMLCSLDRLSSSDMLMTCYYRRRLLFKLKLENRQEVNDIMVR